MAMAMAMARRGDGQPSHHPTTLDQLLYSSHLPLRDDRLRLGRPPAAAFDLSLSAVPVSPPCDATNAPCGAEAWGPPSVEASALVGASQPCDGSEPFRCQEARAFFGGAAGEAGAPAAAVAAATGSAAAAAAKAAMPCFFAGCVAASVAESFLFGSVLAGFSQVCLTLSP